MSDPFAQRKGHTLAWRNARVTLRKDNRTILHSVSGMAARHGLTCIIGHSGAGKTTLLNLLAGKISTDRNVTVEKEVTLDGAPIDPTSIDVKRKIAFVAQHDTLLATATAREALHFSATLRLSKNTSKEDIDNLVDNIITELRLESVADSIIGGPHFRGMSSGEMRRVSLGVELVVRPSAVFLDEVTSGLDSHNAKVVMEVCKEVAKSGAAVVMTLHQPSSAIYELIDHVLLMREGRCLYEGSAQQLPDYFEERGYGMKDNYNPADWAIEVSQTTSTEALAEAGFMQGFPVEKEMISDESHSGTGEDTSTESDESVTEPPHKEKRSSIFDQLEEEDRVSMWKELQMQLVRDLRNLGRDKRAMTLRFIIVILGSCLICVAFQGVGSSDLRSHVGASFFLVLVNVIALQIILLDFIDQRPLFVREFATDHFRMASYGLTKIAVEATSTFFQVLVLVLTTYWSLELTGGFWYLFATLFVFAMVCTSMGVLLASATADPRDAKELIPITILPQLLLCGFFVNIESFPSWLHWAQWLFPLTYTFRLILGEEFRYCMEDPILKCIEAFQHVGATKDILTSATNMLVPQVGDFTGMSAIDEYNNFFSPDQPEAGGFWDVCTIKDTLTVKFNVAHDGFCDLTFGIVSQGQNNPKLVNKDKSPWFQVIRGGRITFTHPEDLKSVAVENYDTYITDSLIGTMVEEVWNNTAVAMSACETLTSHCSYVTSANGFSNTEECLASMETVPLSRKNDHGYSTFDSNSTGCRYVHAALASTQPDVHCPHVSFAPFEDQNGYVKCSESRNIDQEALLGPDASDVFAKTASRFGWTEGDKEISFDIDESSLKPCDTDFGSNDFHLIQTEETSEILECRAFLETQNATGENQTAYWMALLGFFVLFRGLALVLLRNKTK